MFIRKLAGGVAEDATTPKDQQQPTVWVVLREGYSEKIRNGCACDYCQVTDQEAQWDTLLFETGSEKEPRYCHWPALQRILARTKVGAVIDTNAVEREILIDLGAKECRSCGRLQKFDGHDYCDRCRVKYYLGTASGFTKEEWYKAHGNR